MEQLNNPENSRAEKQQHCAECYSPKLPPRVLCSLSKSRGLMRKMWISEWSKSPPQISHWGDHFLWIFWWYFWAFCSSKEVIGESGFSLLCCIKQILGLSPTQSHWAPKVATQNPSLPSLEPGAGSWGRAGFGPGLWVQKDLRAGVIPTLLWSV